MVDVPIYQVDAFTSRAFGGNPAAICPIDGFMDDAVMQSIARENNLSETAFIVPRETPGHYDLRWFTPTVEVDLCGHATLGAGHVVLSNLTQDLEEAVFHTRSGALTVSRDGERYAMRLPNLDPKPVDVPDGLAECLGEAPIEVYHRDRDFLILMRDAASIEALNPDMRALTAFNPFGFLCTAEGPGDVDFVSRCFFPNHGIPEDPVTGSAHCLLAPYWARKLGKADLHALQVSGRGGELWLTVGADHVTMSGHVVDTMRGILMVG